MYDKGWFATFRTEFCLVELVAARKGYGRLLVTDFTDNGKVSRFDYDNKSDLVNAFLEKIKESIPEA